MLVRSSIVKMSVAVVLPVALIVIILTLYSYDINRRSQNANFYRGSSASPTGKYIAVYQSAYHERVSLFSPCGTRVYLQTSNRKDVEILSLAFASALQMNWLDENHLDLIIPWDQRAYADIESNNLGSRVANYKSKMDDIIITLNGKQYSDILGTHDGDCTALNFAQYGLNVD